MMFTANNSNKKWNETSFFFNSRAFAWCFSCFQRDRDITNSIQCSIQHIYEMMIIAIINAISKRRYVYLWSVSAAMAFHVLLAYFYVTKLKLVRELSSHNFLCVYRGFNGAIFRLRSMTKTPKIYYYILMDKWCFRRKCVHAFPNMLAENRKGVNFAIHW